MTVNALNSGAKVWLADFEDASAPTWHNIVTGQLKLIDALDRRIDFTAESGKEYRLGEELPHRSWYGRAAGTFRSSTSWLTGLPSQAASWTSGSICSTALGQLERGSGP